VAAKVRKIKGSWWVVVHHRGKRRHKHVGSTTRDKRVAEALAQRINAQLVLRGTFDVEHREDKPEPVPFRRFVETWLRREIEIPLEREMEGHVAVGTARSYRLQADVHLKPYFQDCDIRGIGLSEVQGFYDHCLETGRPRSSKSIDLALNVMRLVLSYAVGQGLIEHNPVESWRRRRPRRRSSTSPAVAPARVLTHHELESLLATARDRFADAYPLILFLADTGARLGEATALRWVDVDLETRTARICRSYSSGTHLGPTKTGRERVVELSARLVTCLANVEPPVFPHPEDSLVFPNSQGGFLGGHNFRYRVFGKLVAEALGKGRRFSPHGLRHTWASLHMARGTPLKWLQEQGGWTTAKLLLDTYGHFMPTEHSGYADVLSTAPDGTRTAPARSVDVPPNAAGRDSAAISGASKPHDSATTPRSPIMHFTLPPPFFRNSETSTSTGSTPRSRTAS